MLDLWFEQMEQSHGGGPSRETLGHFQSHVRWILDSDKTDHPLKRIRSVLVRAFNLAIFLEAVNGNPATAVPTVPVPREKKMPVPVTAPPARRDDGTWMPWIMVNGQITSKGERVDYGKTEAAIRPIALPDWAVAVLRRRKVVQTPHDLDAVFVTRNDTWHFPSKLQGRLRHIRLLGDYPGLARSGTSRHTRSAARSRQRSTRLRRRGGQNQLGRTSTRMTERHYINRKMVVPDYRAATERLAPGAGADQDRRSPRRPRSSPTRCAFD